MSQATIAKYMARRIVARLPELTVYLSQNREWKLRDQESMFEAAALGLMAANRLDLIPNSKSCGIGVWDFTMDSAPKTHKRILEFL